MPRQGIQWTDAWDATVRESSELGRSLSQTVGILKKTGFEGSSMAVSRRAKALGIEWGRRSKAVDAMHAQLRKSNAERMAVVMARNIDIIEGLQVRLTAPQFTALVKATGGAEEERTLSAVPHQAVRDLTVAIQSLVTSNVKYEAAQPATNGEVKKGLLVSLADSLGVSLRGGE